MIIRRVLEAEWKPLVDLRVEFVESCPTAVFGNPRFMRSHPDSFWISFTRRMAVSEKDAAFLAVQIELPVGFATVSVSDESQWADISMLFVQSKSRRLGLGWQLLTAALDFARARGAKKAFVWVTESNERAKRLYVRAGFVDSGDRRPLRPDLELLQARLELHSIHAVCSETMQAF